LNNTTGIYIAMLWSIRDSSLDEKALETIGRRHRIQSIKHIDLTLNGLRNVMIEVYGKEKWLGNINDHFKGAHDYARSCHKDNSKLMTVILLSDSLDDIKKTKQDVRNIYGIGNYSLHIPDSVDENRICINMLYSKMTIDFLNTADPYRYGELYNNIQEFKCEVINNHLEIDRFAIDSSAVMEAYGIRQAKDIDYITDYRNGEERFINVGDNHKEYVKYYQTSLVELLYDENNYFWFQGVKFITLNNVMKMKKKRYEEKDKKDISLISNFIDGVGCI